MDSNSMVSYCQKT